MHTEQTAGGVRPSIRLVAALLVGLPVLAVGLALTWMWNGQSREGLRRLAEEKIESAHRTVAARVNTVLEIPVRVCGLNHDLIDRGVLDTADPASWRGMLLRQLGLFWELSAITWGDAEGRAAWLGRYENGRMYWAILDDPRSRVATEWVLDERGDPIESERRTFEYGLFDRPWWRSVAGDQSPAWTEPYVWAGGGGGPGTLGISYGVPVFGDSGGLIGVIDADFSLRDLSGFLEQARVGDTGAAVLVDPEGGLIAASGGIAVVSESGERLSVADSAEPLIAGVEGVLEGAAEGEIAARTVIAGEPVLARVTRVGRALGLDWRLVTVVPESAFTGGIEADLRRSGLWSLGSVVAAVAVGVLAARWLVRPTVVAVRGLRRIGEGDFGTRLKIGGVREYAQLGSAINEMAVGLEDRMRMRESLSLAMEVQKNLLPSETPTVRGLDIAGHSTYCDETGGDYYDFLDVHGVGDDSVVVALGDVMGHGVAAAMLMATARGILRSRCAVPGTLGDLLTHLNEHLVPDTGGHRFMTMILATVSPNEAGGEVLRWSTAGHGPPIVYDPGAEGGKGGFLDFEGGGMPLGIMADQRYDEFEDGRLTPGCVLLLSTDGLWEAANKGGEQFGMTRVEAVIRKRADEPAETISQALRDELAEHRGALAMDDDLTFVVVKVTSPGV